VSLLEVLLRDGDLFGQSSSIAPVAPILAAKTATAAATARATVEGEFPPVFVARLQRKKEQKHIFSTESP